MATHFWQFLQNRYTKCLKLRTGKLQTKFQDLTIKAIQINVPFVTFQYCDLKVFAQCIYRQIAIFEKAYIKLGKKYFTCFYLYLVHLHGIFQNKLVLFLDPPAPPPVGLHENFSEIYFLVVTDMIEEIDNYQIFLI